MLEVFRNSFSQEEMLQICRMLYVKAVSGDISAAKIILSYKIGKPLPAPHPDSIDRDEWDHYQNDSIREEEMKLVLSSLPTHSGNDIARVSLPNMTAARVNARASQLLDGLPSKKDEEGAMKEEETEASEPLANGKSDGEYGEKGERSGEKGARTKRRETPLANGKSGRCDNAGRGGKEGKGDETNAAETPLANGKSGRASRGKNGHRYKHTGERRGVSPTCQHP